MLLDTHTILWWQAGGSRLSDRAAGAIARAATMLVSPISCWEIGLLVSKGRVALDRDVRTWVRDLLRQDGVEPAPLTPEIAVAAAMLRTEGFGGDPADQFLYATAVAGNVALVTKDDRFHDFARDRTDGRVIW